MVAYNYILTTKGLIRLLLKVSIYNFNYLKYLTNLYIYGSISRLIFGIHIIISEFKKR